MKKRRTQTGSITAKLTLKETTPQLTPNPLLNQAKQIDYLMDEMTNIIYDLHIFKKSTSDMDQLKENMASINKFMGQMLRDIKHYDHSELKNTNKDLVEQNSRLKSALKFRSKCIEDSCGVNSEVQKKLEEAMDIMKQY